MKIVLFTEEDLITDVFIDIDESLIIKDNDISWKNGALHGISIQYAVLPDNAQIDSSNIGGQITQDIKEQDQSANYIFTDQQAQQMQDMQFLINQMLLDPKNFEQDEQIQQTQQMLNNLMLGGL